MAGGSGGSRKLRPWLLEQLESGRFPGLVWEDPERSALRIPWEHAGKGGARGGAGTALCQAWAEFKGRVRPGERPDPAGWKTRLRCALHKSPEFQELPGRGRQDGPRPYRVYRLLPGPAHTAPPPAKPKGSRPPQGAELGEAPPPQPPEAPGGGAEALGPAQQPPEAPPLLEVVLDSPEPLPPARGDWSLQLRVLVGGALSWQGVFPPGEYLLGPAPSALSPAPPSPAPGLLPRLLLRPRPPGAPCPALRALGAGLLVASTNRGLFLRRKGAGLGREGAGPEEEGAGLRCHAPHAGGGALPRGGGGQPLLGFDGRRFREELQQHRAGLGPPPNPRITLSLGPQNLPLELQLEQTFARRLLDSEGPQPCPTPAPQLPPLPHNCPPCPTPAPPAPQLPPLPHI